MIVRLTMWIALATPAIAAQPAHWCFQAIADPPIPKVADNWPANAIDRFIRARQEVAGVVPGEDADRYRWMRRVYFDLIGLPPSIEEIESFLADRKPDAKARLVDRLLASPRMGEKWAKHWFDMTCYADSVGSSSMPMRYAWRYRDYVIAALNQGTPMDEFVRQQIAGDLLPAKTIDERRRNLTATGFLAIGPWQLSEQDKQQLRADVIDHQITRIGKMFLGLTLDCARCHDHKFDPVGQKDYYALAGIFGNVDVLQGVWRSNLSDLAKRALPEEPSITKKRQADLIGYRKRMNAARQAWHSLRNETKALETQLAQNPNDGALRQQLNEVAKRAQAVREDWRYLEFHEPTAPTIHAALRRANPTNTRVNLRGSAHALGDEVPRGFVRGVGAPANIAEDSDGRLELVAWLFASDNPLTARVLVNRVWARLLGRGLVEPVDYFGLGVFENRPTHPKLLDLLATRFQRDWSLKNLLRSIVLSRTYGLTSASDTTDELYTRFRPRRLDSEAIRDAAMQVSGRLRHHHGGPPIPLQDRTSLAAGDLVNPPTIRGGFKLTAEVAQARAIYQPVIRSYFHKTQTVQEAFDTPSPNEITARRTTTIVPTQALFLLNSPFIREHGAALAATENGSDEVRLRRIWLRTFGRPINARQLRQAKAYLATMKDPKKAWARLGQALLASNEFVFLQ